MGREPGLATDADSETELAGALYSLVAGVAKTIPRDLSPTSVATLGTLEHRGPTRLTRLAALESVAQPSMTLVVSRLEADGLVERRSDESDGRAVLVALTTKGASYLRRRREAGASKLAALMASLPEADLKALRGALPAIARLAAAVSLGPPTQARPDPLETAERELGARAKSLTTAQAATGS